MPTMNDTGHDVPTPMRVGLVGPGGFGRHRARAVLKTPGLRLVAVAGRDEQRARRAPGGSLDVRFCTDGFELARDPNVDAVIICAPPSSHEGLGLACIEAAKHVLCEKPLADSVAACERLVQAAEAGGVCLGTGFNLRFTRAAMLARRLVDHGEVGSVSHIRAFCGAAPDESIRSGWRSDPTQSGGGATMDCGVHMIDLARWFLGDINPVAAAGTNQVLKNASCEDNGFLLLRDGEGRAASLHASWTHWCGHHYQIEIGGSEGFVRWSYPPLQLVHGRRRADGSVRTRHHLFASYQLAERLRGWQWGLVDSLARELRAWADAIRTGSSPAATGRDGLEAVRIASAVMDAADPRTTRPL